MHVLLGGRRLTGCLAVVSQEAERQMILTVLYDNTAFGDLTNRQRLDLVDAFVPVRIKAGDILFRQGLLVALCAVVFLG